MCFVGQYVYHELHKAEEDIVCYKAMREITPELFQSKIFSGSGFKRNTYKLGKTYRARGIFNLPLFSLTRIPHQTAKDDPFFDIEAGFHSYTELPDFELGAKVKCVIPKGTAFYTDGIVNVSVKLRFVARIL